MHHQPLAVEALHRLGRVAAEVQLGVHVVFDQRYLVFDQQLIQRLLLLLAHTRAQRVLQAAHEPAGLDRQLLQTLRQGAQVDALAWVHGDFHGL